MTVSSECLSSFAALFTKIEINPISFLISFIDFFKLSIFVKSQCLKTGTYLYLLNFFTNFFPRFSSLSRNATLDPCCKKFSTIQAPIPEAPPVTITTLLSKDG